MQFIQSIILIVVTTIVTNLFTRKFYISDKDRIIKEKQFKIYEGLYINIVKNRVNEPILSCLAKKNIYHLINALITNENLYNYLNPLLYEQLTSLKDQKISDSDVADIKNQIEEDLENIKYSLGYPCKLKYKRRYERYAFYILNCVYLTYSIQYNLKPLKDKKNTELFWYLTYIQFFLVSFGVFLIFSLIKYLMYNKKLKACVKLIKMRSRESKNQ